MLLAGKQVAAINCKPGLCIKVGDNLLGSSDGSAAVLDDLLEESPSDLGRRDIAVLNLLCAPSLPGSENLNIPGCLTRLARLTGMVKVGTERGVHHFRSDPDYGHCEPMWRMAALITIAKRDFGAAYNPRIRESILGGVREPLTNSRDAFIHGLLDDRASRRWGTCSSIPVLMTAVARRLGYPVGLAVAGAHVYARWYADGVCFNIEASNPMGMTVHSDDGYREKIKKAKSVPGGEMTEDELRSGYYLRTLTPAEEFALFMAIRVESLIDAARYDETLLWSARALQFAPDDPRLPHVAYYALDLAMKHRRWRLRPEQKIPPPDDPKPFFFKVGELLRREEHSLFATIVAHYMEAKGRLDEARQSYEDACQHNFHGNNEQRDLQRFLRKHQLSRRPGPPLPPRNPGQRRRFTLACKPHEEAGVLRGLADQFERDGELVKARDALYDLYMFDPADAQVFQRARAFDEKPKFQEQLRTMIEKRRRELQEPGMPRK